MTDMIKESDNPKLVSEMASAIDTIKEPALRATFERVLENIKSDLAEGKTGRNQDLLTLKKKIMTTPPKEEQLVLAFIPHEMAKVSIFFPMSDKELNKDRRLIEKVEQTSSWGKVIIEGVRLAIFEEDVFLALMRLAKNKLSFDKGQFQLKTSVKELAHLLYGESNYSTNKVAKTISRTLKNFQLVRFELALATKNTTGENKKTDGMVGSIGNIVEAFYYYPETHEFSVFFNPHFCVCFLGSMLTNINFSLRRQLKKDGSKALLRFLSTHSEPGPMHLVTVLRAINFDTDKQPMFKLRQLFKSFLRELKEKGVLGPNTKMENDIITFDLAKNHKSLTSKDAVDLSDK